MFPASFLLKLHFTFQFYWAGSARRILPVTWAWILFCWGNLSKAQSDFTTFTTQSAFIFDCMDPTNMPDKGMLVSVFLPRQVRTVNKLSCKSLSPTVVPAGPGTSHSLNLYARIKQTLFLSVQMNKQMKTTRSETLTSFVSKSSKTKLALFPFFFPAVFRIPDV